MGMVIYRKEQYAVQEVYSDTKKGYILFNTNKPFQDGHTHLNNFKSAKYLISLALNGRLPHDLDRYRMESLGRVLEDGDYRNSVLALLETKKHKNSQTFVNRGLRIS